MNSQIAIKDQKKLSVLLSNQMHKSLKLQALSEDKSITEIITTLIRQYILFPDMISTKEQN